MNDGSRCRRRAWSRGVLLLCVLLLAGCSTVPEEVVGLSNVVSQDTAALHASYVQLIRAHFALLRTQANDFVDNRWAPTFLEKFIETGKLVQRAQGSDPRKVLADVHKWAVKAIERIEKKRRELVEPIDRDERELLTAVDESFARVQQAQATITAHLNSLREVQTPQDQILEAAKLGNLRAKIQDAIAKSSDRAADLLKKVEGEIQ